MVELGIDPKRLMVGGILAGGGLVAATLLLSRDRQGPKVCAQCLIRPALDNRLGTISSRQYVEDSDFMPCSIMEEVWRSSLKNYPQGGHLTPGRTDNLSGLPTTFLDVGRRRCSGMRQWLSPQNCGRAVFKLSFMFGREVSMAQICSFLTHLFLKPRTRRRWLG